MNIPYPIPGFSDPFSSLSHLIGAGVLVVLSFFLLKVERKNFWDILSLCIFSFASIFMLSMSGVYHLLSPDGLSRIVLQRLDHSAIIILIVGTMTPIHQLLFRGVMRWGWLILIWLIAITFLVLKNVFFSSFPEWLGLILFLSLGWGGVVTVGLLWYQRSTAFIKPLVYGGLTYTAGAILEFFRQPVLIEGVIGPHELFHIAVLIGLGFHWYFIYTIAHTNENTIENA
ncbi:MAG: hemolysin III family protein [Rhodothermales bacterium]